MGYLILLFQVFIGIQVDGDKYHEQITTSLPIDIQDPQQPPRYKRRKVFILLPLN